MSKGFVSEDFILSKLLPVGFFVFCIAACMTKAGGVFNVVFPLLAVLVGVVLYTYKPLTYLSFTLWTWMLTPMIRRMSDLQGSFHLVSIMLIAPLAVTSLSLLSIARYRRYFDARAALPLLIVGLVLLYGFFVGMLAGGITSAGLGMANWAMPVAFALHILILPETGADKARMLLRPMVIGGIVMGAYSVFQFVLLPPWDSFWMIQSELESIGRPFPFQVRVFATMNSPGIFAFFAAGCLLAAFSTRSRFRWPSVVLSALGLLLSLVRAGWGACMVSVLLLFYWAPRRQKGSYIAIVLAIVAVLVPVVALTPVGLTISGRFAGLSDTSNDDSYLTRLDLYQTATQRALTSLVGLGLGQTSVVGARLSNDDDKADVSTFDSGILDSFFSLGVLTFVLFGAIGVFVARAWPKPSEPLEVAVFIVAFSVLPAMIFGNTLIAPIGILLYPFLAAAITMKSDRRGSDAIRRSTYGDGPAIQMEPVDAKA